MSGISRQLISGSALTAICLCICPTSFGQSDHEEPDPTTDFSILVTDSDAQPVAGARVMVENDTFDADRFTNSVGKVSFSEVPVGNLEIEIRHTGGGLDIYRDEWAISPDTGSITIVMNRLEMLDDPIIETEEVRTPSFDDEIDSGVDDENGLSSPETDEAAEEIDEAIP